METLLENSMAIWAAPIVTITLLGTAACTTTTSAASPQRVPEVRVATVEQRDVPICHEWIGTLDGMVNAAIRAEVTGYLLSQNYTKGSFVRKGQPLFEIDPRPFQAVPAASVTSQRPAANSATCCSCHRDAVQADEEWFPAQMVVIAPGGAASSGPPSRHPV
jgi:multidrug efflux pump subunit AcrA (membrane-fusion protein)